MNPPFVPIAVNRPLPRTKSTSPGSIRLILMRPSTSAVGGEEERLEEGELAEKRALQVVLATLAAGEAQRGEVAPRARGALYPVVIIPCVHYLGPPGPSTSQILGTFSRFSEDFLGRERDP